jgi:hypothetical protein
VSREPTYADLMVEVLRQALLRVAFCREAVELRELKVAGAILRDLEADLQAAIARRQRVTCPECAAEFAFAGELDHHRRFVHSVEQDERS